MDGSRLNPATRRSRWTWAVRGASGLAVASVVSAAAAADGPRAAVLLPPRVGEPAPAAVVARGAIDDDPLATTPVVRKGTTPRPLVPPTAAKSSGPDWLSGVDPNVMPAGGLSPAKGVTPAKMTLDPKAPVSALPPAGSPKLAPPPPLFKSGEPNPLAKGVEAFKGFGTPDGSAALSPGGSPLPDMRSPHDPHLGKAPNGAPVLAGPPAWRWYGYGSVTPGANAYAPGGQYPRASSNWYSVTKATPGAFPVPVVAPFRSGPGTEPPSYAGTTPAPMRPTFAPVPTDSATLPPPPALNPAPLPPPKLGLMPTPEPLASTPLPVPTMPAMKAPAPVSVTPPSFTPIPLPPPLAVKAPEPIAPAPLATTEPPASRPAAPPILPPLSVMPVIPVPVVPSLAPAVPVVAPVSAPAADEDDVRWKANPTHRPAPAPGVWAQPSDRMRPTGQPGASVAPRLPIARGQIGDDLQEPADPVETVVQAVCRGRATGIDVRHTGPLHVTVCFEARTQTDATALVRDLSARPELARYEVNFCVLVK